MIDLKRSNGQSIDSNNVSIIALILQVARGLKKKGFA